LWGVVFRGLTAPANPENGQRRRQETKQIPGDDRKIGKGKGFDAKAAKVATFRHVELAMAKAREEADSRRE